MLLRPGQHGVMTTNAHTTPRTAALAQSATESFTSVSCSTTSRVTSRANELLAKKCETMSIVCIARNNYQTKSAHRPKDSEFGECNTLCTMSSSSAMLAVPNLLNPAQMSRTQFTVPNALRTSLAASF